MEEFQDINNKLRILKNESGKGEFIIISELIDRNTPAILEKKDINSMESVYFCPSCNKMFARIYDDTNYCSRCGQRIIEGECVGNKY